MEKHHRTASCFFFWISTTMTYIRKYDVICSWLYQFYVLTICTMSHYNYYDDYFYIKELFSKNLFSLVVLGPALL